MNSLQKNGIINSNVCLNALNLTSIFSHIQILLLQQKKAVDGTPSRHMTVQNVFAIA